MHEKTRLGVTATSHEKAASEIISAIRRTSVWVWILAIIAAATWTTHVLGLVPPMQVRLPPEPILRGVGFVASSPDGGGGFMVDETHFLTTRATLGATTKIGDPVKVQFRDDVGGLAEPVAGTVKWISQDHDGVFLVVVAMAERRLDYLAVAEGLLGTQECCTTVGYAMNLQGNNELTMDFLGVDATLGFWQAVWPGGEARYYEGFPVARARSGEFPVVGILSEGTIVVPVSPEELTQAGVRF